MVNRVADKESAKSILKHNGNQAAMIGMEILYTIISTLTVTSMMAAFSAAAVRIYGTTLVSLVVSFINDLSRVSRWGYYSPSMIFSPFKFILMALIFVLLVAATGIVTEMLKAPFEVARYRYYLYLRKNGTRTSASSIFESFDFFVQFAIVTGTREIVIQWLPIVIAVATVILTFVFLLSGVIWLAVRWYDRSGSHQHLQTSPALADGMGSGGSSAAVGTAGDRTLQRNDRRTHW